MCSLVLAGCAGTSDAMYQTLRAALPGDTSAADRAKLNPDLRYLRVTLGGRVALLVLGYLDPDPRGPIEVWYSSEREVLKLQDGRMVGAVGMLTEWRNVTHSEFPQWAALASPGAKARLVRTRDVMPGYRYGVREELELAAIAPPEKSSLRNLDAKALTWFEERVVAARAGEAPLPAARYAVRFSRAAGGAGEMAEVVYGEQCLAPELCFTWQRWPAVTPQPK